MNITQIRNATQIIEYAGKKFLIDPMLAPQGTYPGFAGTVNADVRNPTVELPFSIDEIIDVDAVLLTHTHPDHWDETAIQAIPKETLIFVQHEGDEQILRNQDLLTLKFFLRKPITQVFLLHEPPVSMVPTPPMKTKNWAICWRK